MSKKKLIVDKYDPQIYPYPLYVAKNYTNKELMKRFDLTEEELLNNEESDFAYTYWGVKHKPDMEWCCLVLLTSKSVKCKDKFENVDTCAHEALHYVLHLMETIGNTQPWNKSHEPYCYLQGWATKCIYTTLCK
jgi:hypothetical protein